MAEDPHWSRFAKAQRHIAVRTIPNGIAAPSGIPTEEERLAYRRTAGVPGACPLVVGTVGRLDPARQPWLYPKIFGPIARRFPDVHFVMGGAGPELERVQQAIAEEGLEGRVHLPGLVQNPRLAFSIMDLYVTLNVGPITGVAAIEAAFAGLPIVAIQLLEGYRARDGDWIWSSADTAEIAERAIALIGEPERLRALAERQRAYAEAHHSIEVMADAYDSLYEAARANARGGAAHSVSTQAV
jgi:glycosyltransferase involved in cell wall biosynthesis